MIVDRMQNWQAYEFGPAWRSAFEFLGKLTTETADGRYELQGDDIFAIVMSYETRGADEAILEAHRRYVDIQTVLRGREGFEWFPASSLVVAQPYDAVKDVEFFQRLGPGSARVDIGPSLFIALFPDDAHMATLMLGNQRESIKKVVVKIREDLLIPWKVSLSAEAGR